MQEKKTRKLETGDRLLMLLECFTVKPEWGVTELSEKLGLYKSVVHRLLVTLENRGFVSQDHETKKYTLGLKVFELGMVVASRMKLRAIARPIMEELVQKTNETVILVVVDGFNGICIEKVESPQSIKCTSQVGKRVPLHAGAPTRLLMAYLPQEKIEEIIQRGLQKFTESTITDPHKLREELKIVRQNGYCISYGELDFGSAGVACPIINYEGKVIASLSVLGPEFRMGSKIEEYLLYCKNAAKAISQQLGAQTGNYPWGGEANGRANPSKDWN